MFQRIRQFLKLPPRPPRPLKNQKGMAILMALTAIALMTFVAIEVSYDTNVEYLVASQQVNRIKAYYAAKAGIEISLLRILIYKKALGAFGDQLGGSKSMLDPIWSFPFSWPPVLPEDMNSVSKDMIDSVIAESNLDAQYIATIEAEGGKIDINDLGSELEILRTSTKAQILKIFDTEMQNNDEFSDKMGAANFEEIVNNITDWIDANEESLNGGPESGYYRDVQSDFIPPNQPLKTIGELHMIAGVTDDIFNVLAPRVTVFGVKGINVNYAPKEVLMGLDHTVTEEAADAIISRRNNPDEGGPFQSKDDFLGFAQSFNVNTQAIENTGVPLLFGAESNFRIRSTGQYANVTRDIVAITYDFENLTEHYLELWKEEDAKNAGTDPSQNPSGNTNSSNTPAAGGGETGQPKKQIKIPKGRPTIVYWEEN